MLTIAARLERVRGLLREVRPLLDERREEYRAEGEEDLLVEPRPVLSEETLAEFESAHAVALPHDYRAFLAVIGNGGPGPGYGMFDLTPPLDAAALSPVEGDVRIIPLSPLGCGMEWELVVSGPDAGNVWFYCETGFEPCDPPRRFLDWYEAWLAEELVSDGVKLIELIASGRLGEHE